MGHGRSNPTVNFCSEVFLLGFTATVLTFFIAGLLYLLCFKHVDNLGAYSIPSETGLLIPSVYINRVGSIIPHDYGKRTFSRWLELEIQRTKCTACRILGRPLARLDRSDYLPD